MGDEELQYARGCELTVRVTDHGLRVIVVLCMWKLATSTWVSVRYLATWSSSHVDLLFVSIATRCSVSIDVSICLFGNL